MAGGVQGYNVVLFCCLFSFCNNKILDLDGYTHTWTFLLLCYGKLVNALIRTRVEVYHPTTLWGCEWADDR